MNIRSLLQRLRRPWSAPAVGHKPAHAGKVDPDRPLGCGWFESSHELQCGLIIHEHADPETLASELPLANWLELQLSGWRGRLPA